MAKLISRKEFVKYISLSAGMLYLPGCSIQSSEKKDLSGMKLGLVTYLWGKEWDIPTLIDNCSEAGIYGVELRIDHAHGVNLEMSAAERNNVKKQFAQSDVKVLGMGTNQQFDYPDQTQLNQSIEIAKNISSLVMI